MTISSYDHLFADKPLDQILLEARFPDGTKLDVARTRLWEGNTAEVAALTSGQPEPWAALLLGLARVNAGQNALPQLRAVAENAFFQTRPRLWAWTALRKLGEKPSQVYATEVLGVVVEVPVDGGLDVLAVYADGSLTYINHSDHLVTREGGDPTPTVTNVISNGFVLLSVPPADRDPDAGPPPEDHVRLTALSALGIHRVEVPWKDVEAGGTYQPLFSAAIVLLDEITPA